MSLCGGHTREYKPYIEKRGKVTGLQETDEQVENTRFFPCELSYRRIQELHEFTRLPTRVYRHDRSSAARRIPVSDGNRARQNGHICKYTTAWARFDLVPPGGAGGAAKKILRLLLWRGAGRKP